MTRLATVHAAPGTLTSRVLLLALGGHHYAIRASEVAALAECGPLRAVPWAPRAVLGLGEWRGNVLTVLDLPHLLGHPPTEETQCLVALAAPLHRAALWPGSGVRMAEVVDQVRPNEDEDGPASHALEGLLEHEGELLRLISVLRLTRSVERSRWERS